MEAAIRTCTGILAFAAAYVRVRVGPPASAGRAPIISSARATHRSCRPLSPRRSAVTCASQRSCGGTAPVPPPCRDRSVSSSVPALIAYASRCSHRCCRGGLPGQRARLRIRTVHCGRRGIGRVIERELSRPRITTMPSARSMVPAADTHSLMTPPQSGGSRFESAHRLRMQPRMAGTTSDLS